ncbi:DASS family sodium-coupled anion symporter [Cytobacillus kochii]|uniref:SLC13 family permease n=1 Tax=Cytobacillus kochii TaxID=859143 RepID=UPI001CD1EDDC|nr:DASS family sodium-coupled anion symporter [Cytobacillus kochii]MCA1025205.1 DASS family sodium-coupled anion symporter [Cytobacillus kochii]
MLNYMQGFWMEMWRLHDQIKDLLRLFSVKNESDKNQSNELKQSDENNGENPKQRKRTKKQNIGLLLGPILFALTLLFVSPEGMSREAQAVLASTLWVAVWWITEAIPIPVTSLLPIILFPVTGAVTEGITSSYADNTIFLFLGGFIIAIAMEKWNLHLRIALGIITVVGTSTSRLVLGFMVATGFLSMWISNTATAMMMMPIAIAVITHVNDSMKSERESANRFGKSLMLGIAYAASIGGLGTLIGTPPNMIFAGVVKEIYGIDISFATWMLFGVPFAAILLLVAWFYLIKIAFPMRIKELPGGKEIISSERKRLGNISFEEKLVLVVFLATAVAWITRSFIPFDFMSRIDDTIIAIAAAIILFLLPSKSSKDSQLLNWKDALNIPWGILLLFGGGLAIAKGFKDSGLATWIGEQLTVLEGVHLVIVILCVTALVTFLTEITSNTATATMMFPIMASLALALDLHPYALMVAAAIAASCAFMLPVATPPNAIVFGSGYLKIGDMAKSGFWLSIFTIIFVGVMIYFYMPIAWGIDIGTFPNSFK